MNSMHERRYSEEHKASLIDDGSGVARAEYLKAGIVGLIGAVILAIMFMTESRGTESAEDFIGISIGIAAQVALGLPVLLLVAAMTGAGGGTLLLTVVRLLGITLAVMPLWVFMAPVPCYSILVVLLIMTGLIMWLFEFENYQALLVVVLLYGLNFGIFVLLLPWALGN